MQRIRLISRLAIVALTIAACSKDSAATSASAVGSSSAPVSSAAPTSSEPTGKELHATSASGPPTIGEPICDAEQHCMYPLTLTGTLSGDVTGTSISHSAGALVGTKFAASDTLIFTGTVAGCGTGTMVIVGTGVGSTDGASTSEWTIVDGFGSGGLARAHGSGSTTTTKGDGSVPATITAHITCD